MIENVLEVPTGIPVVLSFKTLFAGSKATQVGTTPFERYVPMEYTNVVEPLTEQRRSTVMFVIVSGTRFI